MIQLFQMIESAAIFQLPSSSLNRSIFGSANNDAM